MLCEKITTQEIVLNFNSVKINPTQLGWTKCVNQVGYGILLNYHIHKEKHLTVDNRGQKYDTFAGQSAVQDWSCYYDEDNNQLEYPICLVTSHVVEKFQETD